MRSLTLLPLLFPAVFLISCSKNDAGSTAGTGTIAGINGSLSRFTVVSGHLYTISGTEMNLYDISNPGNPVFGNKIILGRSAETLFPNDTTLYTGTETGMGIYSIKEPEKPVLLSFYQHARSCDPVIVNGTYAFVSLRKESPCSFGLSQLDVVDVSDLQDPKLVKSYPMVNPYGLAADGTNLFVCDDGIKYYDASNVNNLVLKKKLQIDATDVIAHDGILIVVGSDGLYQYDYSHGDLTLLSKIPTT